MDELKGKGEGLMGEGKRLWEGLRGKGERDKGRVK